MSRKIASRFTTQTLITAKKKTQDMQELQEKHQDKYKKNFSKKRLNITICPKEFFKEKGPIPGFMGI